MNPLFLKTLVWNEQTKGFCSPTHHDFVWPKGIVARYCAKCETDNFNPECTCGIYGSPHPNTLVEYAKYKNSVFVLMNSYGWMDVWTGPSDLPNTYITRSWGAQIIGIVGTMIKDHPFALSPQRLQVALLGVDYYQVEVLSWSVAKDMIAITWEQHMSLCKYPYSILEKELL